MVQSKAAAPSAGAPGRCPSLAPREGDTRNADFYYDQYYLSCLCRTIILLIGGAFALWTLNQNHKFKQARRRGNMHQDYFAIEQQAD